MSDVTFMSDRFSTTPAADAINDSLGADIAAWLRAELADAGYDVSEVIAEDYGYGFWLTIEDAPPYWITAQEYLTLTADGKERDQWLVGIHANAGCNPLTLFRRQPSPHIPQIAAQVHTALIAEPSVSEIEWWAVDVGRGEASPQPPDLP